MDTTGDDEMNDYKGTLEAGDIEWLRKIATGDAEDIMLSVGRTQRILNSIKELELQLDDAKETCIEHARIQISLCKTIDKVEAQLAELKSAWAGTKFVSSDKDNMEFNVRITYWQKETLQDILK